MRAAPGDARSSPTPRLRDAGKALSTILERRWLLPLVAVVALAIRLPLGFYAPPFVDHDTRQYLHPAFNLLSGDDFDLPLVRTPGYPLFLTAVMAVLGPDYTRVLIVQHVLGAITALLATEIGRMLAGRYVGAAAGLLVALSGSLAIAEHYLLTEGLFTLTVMLTCWAALLALRHERQAWLLVATGLLCGLTALVRPIGLVLLPLPVLSCVLDGRGVGRTVRAASLIAVGGALVLLPWMTYNLVNHGVFELTHRDGDSLITYVSLYSQKRYRPLSEPDPSGDPRRTAARKLVNDAMYGGLSKSRAMSGTRISDELVRRLGFTPVEADDLLAAFALEQIRAQPGTYVSLLLENATRVYLGRPVDLLYAWETPASANPGSLPVPWGPATGDQNAWLPFLTRLVGIYDPSRWAIPIALLAGVGVIAAAVDPRYRPTLLPAAMAVALLLTAVGVVGPVYRYRYPVDPLVTIVALVGLNWLGRRLRAGGYEFQAGRRRSMSG